MPIQSFRINPYGRTYQLTHEQAVHQLIEQLLFTMPGERVNRPDLGSGLMQLIFSPNNNELLTASEFLIRGALQQWLGDLIVTESVQIVVQEEVPIITVQYLIRENLQRRIERFIVPQLQ